MKIISHFMLTLLICFFVLASNATGESFSTLRGSEITVETETKAIRKVINKDIKQRRNYPMQPPVIPHTIRGYALNLQVNKCLSCHSRNRVEESQAPMVSVTHFMDRDGNFLAEISPRRYFCNQCHVTQPAVRDTVENTFEDMDVLLEQGSSNEED